MAKKRKINKKIIKKVAGKKPVVKKGTIRGDPEAIVQW
jgi:hypothetical protein